MSNSSVIRRAKMLVSIDEIEFPGFCALMKDAGITDEALLHRRFVKVCSIPQLCFAPS